MIVKKNETLGIKVQHMSRNKIANIEKTRFKSIKITFHGSIVIGTAGSAHALNNVILITKRNKFF